LAHQRAGVVAQIAGLDQRHIEGGAEPEIALLAGAAVLFVTVEKFEPNRLYAYLLMFLIIALGTLAILNQVVPKPDDDRYMG
jgi:hypothetical protein